MAETNYDIAHELAETRTMAQGLETYVRGDALYGSAGSSGAYLSDPSLPSLTLGAFLLRLRRLQAQESQMSAAQKAILSGIAVEHERVRSEWAEHYSQKLQQELSSRLQSIGAFIADCDDDPVSCAGAYLPAALSRTIVEDGLNALKQRNLAHADLDGAIQREDEQLRRVTEPTGFIWSSALQSIYPQEPYWWLYARPRTHQ